MPTPDHDLGAELRLRRPPGPVSRQVLEGMVRDLVGADQSFLAPLLHLVGCPGFLALEPGSVSSALCLLGRDQLLNDLQETYHPLVVLRLRDVLDGYLQLCASDHDSTTAALNLSATELVEPPSAATAFPSPASLPVASLPPAFPSPTQPSLVQYSPQPLPAAPLSAPPSTSSDPSWQAIPSGPVQGTLDSTVAVPSLASTHQQLHSSNLRLPLLVAAAVAGGTLLGVALQRPPLCQLLGLCNPAAAELSQGSIAAGRALSAAEKAANAMESARDLPAYKAAVADLERNMAAVSTESLTLKQGRQRQKLQATAQDGQQRLAREQQQAASVAQASRRIDALPSLPIEQQSAERGAIRQSLTAIPKRSFSYGRAQELLKRLEASLDTAQPTAPDSAPQPEPTSRPEATDRPEATVPASPPAASSPQAAPLPQPRPQPAPPPARALRWRPPAPSASSGSQGNSTPQRRQNPAPAPAQPQDDGNSNAPYRDDPLF